MPPDKTGEKQRSPHVWEKGRSGNPAGRPKGSRNKLGEAYVQDLYEAWRKGGPDVITKVMEKKPAEFLKVIASLLPKEVAIIRPENEMTDEELDAHLNVIAGLIADRRTGADPEPTHSGGGTA